MDRRSPAEAAAMQARSLIVSAGRTLESVAEATDVPASKIAGHPSAGELTFRETVALGGFLHVRPELFYKGVAA